MLGHQPAVPAVQHRPALDAELHEPRERRRFRRCRPARRSSPASGTTVLRRPGLDLRPRRPAAVPEPAPDPDGGIEQRRHARHAERALDRDPGADLEADEGRLGADEPDELEGRARRLRRRPAAARCGSCTTTAATSRPTARGSRSRASATRSSTRSIVPMSRKDEWNATDPADDKDFLRLRPASRARRTCCPILYPGVFPNLAALNASGASRADLVAILLTGLPAGDHPGLPEPEREPARTGTPTCCA